MKVLLKEELVWKENNAYEKEKIASEDCSPTVFA